VSKKDLDFDKLVKFINKIKPLRLVISGGEPLLLYKKLKKVILKLKFKPYITLVTNGTIFNKEISLFLKNNVAEVVISLDTLNRERFEVLRGANCLDKVLKNIAKIARLKIKKRINFSIFSNNMVDFNGIVKFMKKNKIKNISVLRKRAVGRSKEKIEDKVILDFYKRVIDLAKKEKINLSIHDPIVNKLCLNEFETICYAGDKIISIDADFNYKTCPFAGDSFKGEFIKVWNSKAFKKQACNYSCIKQQQ